MADAVAVACDAGGVSAVAGASLLSVAPPVDAMAAAEIAGVDVE
jgi:hypothetical protein